MYQPNTIVTRIKRNPDEPSPLDVLRVIGPSPVKTPSLAEWANSGGEYLIVQPVEIFATNEVIPESVLNEQYEVTTYGDEPDPQRIVLDTPRQRMQNRETPEQAFARAARENTKSTSKRGKTQIGDA